MRYPNKFTCWLETFFLFLISEYFGHKHASSWLAPNCTHLQALHKTFLYFKAQISFYFLDWVLIVLVIRTSDWILAEYYLGHVFNFNDY